MDMITLAMAKGYTDSQRLGYTETTNVLIAEAEVNGEGYFPEYKSLTVGETYKVIINGKTYTLVAFSLEGFAALMSEGESWIIADNGEQLGFESGESEKLYKISIYQETEVIHPIDPKYLPAMDSVTLNGADGKQYKVAVDANGALTATAIE